MERYDSNITGGYLQIPVCDKTVTSDISGDFTLPDYQPEIKRLLRVSASVLPPSKYIGDSAAELAGGIDYYVLYMGGDNELYCAPLSADYKVDIPFDASELAVNGYLGGFALSAATGADMVSGRVTAPRKLSIKCRLKTRAQIFADMPLEDGFGEGEEGLQRLACSADVSRRAWGVGEMLRISDEMICESAGGELRVICAEGKVLIGEVTAMKGAAACRGDLYLKLLLCRDDGGVPYSANRKIPFSQTVAVEGMTAGDSASARGTVSEMGIVVEDGRIGIDVGMIIEVDSCREESVSYVKDVYSTARQTENLYKSVPVISGSESFSGNFTLSDSAPLDEVGIARASKIIDISGAVYPEEYALESDKCTVRGRAKFSMLWEKDGEYSVSEMELPFSYRVAASDSFDKAACLTELISARARVDEDRVGVDAEIGICGNLSRSENEKMLSAVGFGEEIVRERGKIVVCYPSSDDSLWSVAKRYGASLETLASVNSLSRAAEADSAQSLEGVKYLVVE